MELNITSTVDLRWRFSQTEPTDPQRIALLRDALTSADADDLVNELVSEYSIGIQMDEPHAAVLAHTNLEMIRDALRLLPNELPENVNAVCAELVYRVDTTANEAQLLSRLVNIACDVVDALQLLQQEGTDATNATTGRDTGRVGEKLSRLFKSTQSSARVCEEVLVSALDAATAPQPMLDALGGVVQAIAGSAGQLLTAITPTTAAEPADQVWRVTASALGVLNIIAIHEHDLPALQATEASQQRDIVVALLDAATASYDDTLGGLPPELWAHILHFTQPADIERFAMTSKTFKALVSNYQQGAEGVRKHEWLIAADKQERMQAVKNRYQAWFKDSRLMARVLVIGLNRALHKLTISIHNLHEFMMELRARTKTGQTLMLESRSNLLDFIIGLATEGESLPLWIFQRKSHDGIVDGAAERIYYMVKASLPELLAQARDSLQEDVVGELRHEAVKRLEEIGHAREAVLASYNMLTAYRDEHARKHAGQGKGRRS